MKTVRVVASGALRPSASRACQAALDALGLRVSGCGDA